MRLFSIIEKLLARKPKPAGKPEEVGQSVMTKKEVTAKKSAIEHRVPAVKRRRRKMRRLARRIQRGNKAAKSSRRKLERI